MKTLSDHELGYLKNLDQEVELSQARLAISLLKVANLELRIKNLAYELEKEKNSVETLRSAEAQAKIVRKDALKTLQKKHELGEGWGYNPDSGEIVDNTQGGEGQ